MKRLWAVLGGALVLAGGLAIASCKQGENDHCQVDDDCESGLTCVEATMTCETIGNNQGDIDAAVPDGIPVDASPDAPRPDAAPDAPPDAPVDAPPDADIDATLQ